MYLLGHFDRFLQKTLFLFELLLRALLHYLAELRSLTLPILDLLHPHHDFELPHRGPFANYPTITLLPLSLSKSIPFQLLFFSLKRFELLG